MAVLHINVDKAAYIGENHIVKLHLIGFWKLSLCMERKIKTMAVAKNKKLLLDPKFFMIFS